MLLFSIKAKLRQKIFFRFKKISIINKNNLLAENATPTSTTKTKKQQDFILKCCIGFCKIHWVLVNGKFGYGQHE